MTSFENGRAGLIRATGAVLIASVLLYFGEQRSVELNDSTQRVLQARSIKTHITVRVGSTRGSGAQELLAF